MRSRARAQHARTPHASRARVYNTTQRVSSTYSQACCLPPLPWCLVLSATSFDFASERTSGAALCACNICAAQHTNAQRSQTRGHEHTKHDMVMVVWKRRHFERACTRSRTGWSNSDEVNAHTLKTHTHEGV